LWLRFLLFGRLVMQLQTVSKLLRVYYREAQRTTIPLTTKEHEVLPQICADDRRLDKEKASTTKDTRSTPLSQARVRSGQATEHKAASEVRTERDLAANHLATNHLATNQGEETRIALVTKIRAFAERRGWGHAPPELFRAA
jgi:hypothetical protein